MTMEYVDEDLDGSVSDNDVEEEIEDGPWFSMSMTKEEKVEARRPRRLSLIIKLVGQSIGYPFLLHRLQAMWKTHQPFTLSI